MKGVDWTVGVRGGDWATVRGGEAYNAVKVKSPASCR